MIFNYLSFSFDKIIKLIRVCPITGIVLVHKVIKCLQNGVFLCSIIPTASEYYAINLEIADIRLCRTQ